MEAQMEIREPAEKGNGWISCLLQLRAHNLSVKLVQNHRRRSITSMFNASASAKAHEFEFNIRVRDFAVTPGLELREFTLSALDPEPTSRQSYGFRAGSSTAAIEWQRSLIRDTLDAGSSTAAVVPMAPVGAFEGSRQDYLRSRKVFRKLQNAFEAWRWCHATARDTEVKMKKWRRSDSKRLLWKVLKAWRRVDAIVVRKGDRAWLLHHLARPFWAWNSWYWRSRQRKQARTDIDYSDNLMLLELAFLQWKQCTRARKQHVRRMDWYAERRRNRVRSCVFVAWRYQYSTFVRHFATLRKAARMSDRRSVRFSLLRWQSWCEARAGEKLMLQRHRAKRGGTGCRTKTTLLHVLHEWYDWFLAINMVRDAQNPNDYWKIYFHFMLTCFCACSDHTSLRSGTGVRQLVWIVGRQSHQDSGTTPLQALADPTFC